MSKNDNTTFEFYAFISYNSKDYAWGKRLQRKLEHYSMPAKMCRERGWKRNPIQPVFFAPTDIQLGDLDEELKAQLRASRNLIVVCSPNSARSVWVGKEIEYFHSLGREKNIFFFIVDGIPNSGDPETECFHPIIKKLGIPENLGANIHEENISRYPWITRERAYVQLITSLLGIKFDSIWKRHRRRLIAKIVSWIVGILAVLAALSLVWVYNQPFDSVVRLREVSAHNPYLPPMADAVVTMSLDKETKTDTVCDFNDAAVFADIPHRCLGKDVRITVACPNFVALDTTVALSEQLCLNMARDPLIYGDIRKKLWDWRNERGVADTEVTVDGRKLISDSEGIIRLDVPLEQQKEFYIIEIPSWNVCDTVFMPCDEGQIIILE